VFQQTLAIQLKCCKYNLNLVSGFWPQVSQHPAQRFCILVPVSCCPTPAHDWRYEMPADSGSVSAHKPCLAIFSSTRSTAYNVCSNSLSPMASLINHVSKALGGR